MVVAVVLVVVVVVVSRRRLYGGQAACAAALLTLAVCFLLGSVVFRECWLARAPRQTPGRRD